MGKGVALRKVALPVFGQMSKAVLFLFFGLNLKITIDKRKFGMSCINGEYFNE